jgi:2-oxoglutarate dehydrogenase E1 component
MEEWTTKEWEALRVSEKYGKVKDTGVNVSSLKEIGEKITTLPDDWDFHPQVKKIYEQRRKSVMEGKGIDWGTAEALAFATLIDEGFHVRLSG